MRRVGPRPGLSPASWALLRRLAVPASPRGAETPGPARSAGSWRPARLSLGRPQDGQRRWALCREHRGREGPQDRSGAPRICPPAPTGHCMDNRGSIWAFATDLEQGQVPSLPRGLTTPEGADPETRRNCTAGGPVTMPPPDGAEREPRAVE